MSNRQNVNFREGTGNYLLESAGEWKRREEREREDDEFSGGIILQDCPNCGQYCKIPERYHINGLGQNAHAHSYCKRCKKAVELEVVFI